MECMATIAFVNQTLIHGANKMNNNYFIHPAYSKNNEIIDFVNDLIFYQNHKSFDDLDIKEKCKFSAIISKISGPEDQLEFIETYDPNVLMELFRKSMSTYKDFDKNYFMEHMENAFVSHYENTMENLFNYYLNLFVENAA